MSDVWQRGPSLPWSGIPSGALLLWNLRLPIALQDVLDRHAAADDGPRCTVQGCGVKVAWSQDGTQLYHLPSTPPPFHQPRLDDTEDQP